MEFCEKLIRLRRARGMTQLELAEALGVTRQSVYKWERGVSYPEAMTLFAMRELFEVSVDALLDPACEVTLPPPPAPIIRLTTPSPVQQETTEASPPEMPAAAPEADSVKKKRGFFSRLFRK